MGFIFTAHGLISNHTARIMFEVTRSDAYIFSYYKLGEQERTSLEYDVKAGKPCVIQLEQLERGKTYFYSLFDPETNDIINDSFTTLNTNFVMISPNHEIHEVIYDSPRANTYHNYEHQNNKYVIFSPDTQELRHDGKNEEGRERECHVKQENKIVLKLGTEPDLEFNQGVNIFVNYKLSLEHIEKHYKNMTIEDFEHVKNIIRNTYRKQWDKLSGSNIMIANYDIKSKNPLLQECIKEVYDEFQRGLRINNHTSIKDHFMIQYGKIGFIMFNELNDDTLHFIKHNMGRLNVAQWVIVSPDTIFTKKNKKIMSSLFALFPHKLPLFVSTENKASRVIFIKRSNKTIGYQIHLKANIGTEVKSRRKLNKYVFKLDHRLSQPMMIDFKSQNDTTLLTLHNKNTQHLSPYKLTV